MKKSFIQLDPEYLLFAYREDEPNSKNGHKNELIECSLEYLIEHLQNRIYTVRITNDREAFKDSQKTNYIDIIIGVPITIEELINQYRKYKDCKDVMQSLFKFKANKYKTVVLSPYYNLVGIKPHQNIICHNKRELLKILLSLKIVMNEAPIFKEFGEEEDNDFSIIMNNILEKSTNNKEVSTYQDDMNIDFLIILNNILEKATTFEEEQSSPKKQK